MRTAANFLCPTEAMNNQSAQNPRSESEKAISSACNILAYADNTERQLRRKLRDKGYGPDSIEYAVDYVKTKGFLDESRMLESAVHSLIRYKYFGLSRIRQELHAKGFRDEIISEYDFSQIDFLSVCRELYMKHGGTPDEKTYAFLLRHGHRAADIKTVFRESRDGGD